MESIFHEKQEGYLCAQHCLNALLQGPYFNAVDLANFGHQMDEEERIRMAESGIDSEDYKYFLEQPSGNMDDSGYFSVQVISSALKVWGLELVPYNSTEPAALVAQNDPSQMKAYICNYKGHWFTIRKLGKQWFNLNSILNGPQLISDTYLALYLTQLLQEGYSIFIVIGALPQCPAEDVLTKTPVVVVPKVKENVQVEEKPIGKGYRLGSKAEDELLKAVIALEEVAVPSAPSSSTVPAPSGVRSTNAAIPVIHPKTCKEDAAANKPRERIIPITIEKSEEDDESDKLQRAVELSLIDNTKDDINENLKLRLDLHNDKMGGTINLTDDTDEDDELRKAVQLSLECVTAPPTPDPEDLRWRRLNHFGIYSTASRQRLPKS